MLLCGNNECHHWHWTMNPDIDARITPEVYDIKHRLLFASEYGAMFFSVVLADTLACGDPARAIDTALCYVPPRSRFAEAVRFVQAQCRASREWERVNAAITIMALLLADGDFTRALGISVMAGLDTDCNAATTGSIMGCAVGTAGIPSHWTAPLHNRVRTDLKGIPELSLSDLAQRTAAVAARNARRQRETPSSAIRTTPNA